MNASFWVARSRDTDTCTDVTDTNNQWVYSVVYHIANDTWPDAHCIIALWRRIGLLMELLVTRKSLKVVLQGHFSGYPSHKTYTCQKERCKYCASWHTVKHCGCTSTYKKNTTTTLYKSYDSQSTRIKVDWSHFYQNTSQPSPGRDVHCSAKWVAHPWASQVSFCAFFCAIFACSHDSTLLSHLFHVELSVMMITRWS